MTLLNQRQIVQNAYVVNDVFKAAERMTELVGAGPFFVLEHIPLSECLYRGDKVISTTHPPTASAGRS